MSIDLDDITAVILAGGKGRRMGGQDKGLIEFDAKPLAAILVERLDQQGVRIVINANRNHDRYQQFGHPVITDTLEDYQGPLAGFASAMAATSCPGVLTIYAHRLWDCARILSMRRWSIIVCFPLGGSTALQS